MFHFTHPYTRYSDWDPHATVSIMASLFPALHIYPVQTKALKMDLSYMIFKTHLYFNLWNFLLEYK